MLMWTQGRCKTHAASWVSKGPRENTQVAELDENQDHVDLNVKQSQIPPQSLRVID